MPDLLALIMSVYKPICCNHSSVVKYILSRNLILFLHLKVVSSQATLHTRVLILKCLTFEAITVLNQMTVTSRQTSFIIFRNNSTKIGMNTFVYFKKLMKTHFLKYGKTWPDVYLLQLKRLNCYYLNDGQIT